MNQQPPCLIGALVVTYNKGGKTIAELKELFRIKLFYFFAEFSHALFL